MIINYLLNDLRRLPIWWNSKTKIFGNVESTNRELYTAILIVAVLVTIFKAIS
jgi:hypothetical protein